MIKAYTSSQLDQLKGEAASAQRRRSNLNVHAGLDANVQRLFIATQPDTYMRPHRQARGRHLACRLPAATFACSTGELTGSN